MKLFVDENLSPELTAVCHGLGYDATCNRNRALLSRRDDALLDLMIEEDRVLLTINGADFQTLCGNVDLHPGLIIFPDTSRDRSLELCRAALDHIQRRATDMNVAERDFMINRVVEVAADGSCTDDELP